MKSILLISSLLICYVTHAQKQDYNWCFGDSCGIHFSDTSALAFTSSLTYDTSYVLNLEAAASISDTGGNLLFYTNGPMVWNRNHQLMPHGTGLHSWTTITNGSLILPKPKDSSLYYLFHISILPSGFYYALIDMNLDNGFGDIVSGKKNVLLNNDIVFSEKLAAVKHANGRDWWVINRSMDSDIFYIYLLTPDTIILYSTQTLGSIPSQIPNLFSGEMVFSPKGDKLAFTGYPGIINLFDFDRCGGTISNFIDLSEGNSTNYYGCSFSPEGTKLYASSDDDLYQFNLEDSDIVGSKTLIWNNPYYGPGSIYPLGQHQITPNGKIFIAMGHTTPSWTDTFIIKSLCVINDPDEEGVACDFVPLSFYLLGHTEDSGLPNSPNYNLGSLLTSPCDTLATNISKINLAKTISLYPNPFTNEVTISMKNFERNNYNLEVYDIRGKEVCRYSLKASSTSLDLGYLQNGMYLYQVKKENEVVWREKIVKE